MQAEKEYLYVGHYIDVDGNYILKVGTTNDLEARKAQHNRYYTSKARKHPMPPENSFEYDGYIRLSKYNTLRYEEKTKAEWKKLNLGHYVNNDRFCCTQKPATVSITIRKTYTFTLR